MNKGESMRFENVRIVSVVHVDAPIRVRSEDIEARLAPTMQRLGVRPDLLRELSGIEERRWWDEGVEVSDAATLAGQKAIEAAEIESDQLGILVNTSVCRQYLEPSTACLVHGNLQLPSSCVNFDLSNACLGFVNGMDVVGNMIERGQIDYGIIVDAEDSRSVVRKTIDHLLQPETDEEAFRKNFATLTLGSGAAAMVMGRADLEPDGHRFLGGVSLAATEHNRLCFGNFDGMVTDTRALTIAGLELAARTWQGAVQKMGWSTEVLDHYVLHQVSKAHTEKFAGILGLQMEKIYRLYPDHGNVGPAGVPMVMSKLDEAGSLQSGQRVAVMGIGSGINCTMAEVVW